MASLASLATVGSARVNSTSLCEGSYPLFGRAFTVNRWQGKNHCSFSSNKHGGNCPKWTRISAYCCLGTTGLLEGEVKSFSSDNYLKEGDDEVVLKPAPKPVLRRVESTPKVESTNSNLVGARWAPKRDVNSAHEKDKPNQLRVEEEKQVANVIGNHTATEKLEADKRTNSQNYNYDGKGVKSAKQSKPQPKNVWKKGNPVSYVRRSQTPTASASATSTVLPNIQKKEESFDEETIKKEEGPGQIPATSSVTIPPSSSVAPPLRARSPSPAPLPPPVPPPLKIKPKLQGKPMPVSTATANAAPTKKQVILKDVGAGPKQVILKDIGAAPKKERKSVVEDVNTTIADADEPSLPSKVGKASKTKDDWRRKRRPASGLRKAEIELDEEEAEELDIPISGASKFSGRKKGRKFSKASRKAARAEAARAGAPVQVEILEIGKQGMSVVELAHNLAVHEAEIVTKLFMKGIVTRVTQTLDQDTVKMVCKDYDVEIIDADDDRVEDMAKKKEIFDEEDLDKLQNRPPVLTIMGHVDHGKTTLLDYIRKTKVSASEAGGITQGIGAYKVLVPVDNDHKPCVFLDTPGHEAFSAMRARGARVTDIAIIVVAADDGVRPQTNEAIAHAKAANVPIVVAINKIDKEGASPERVMQELSSVGLMPEEWGGDVPMVQVSALSGQNVNDLLETVMLVAELQELKANPDRNAKGTIIEAGLHKSRGPLATFLVQNGTLKKGDVVVCGETFGKVRALLDDTGSSVDKAGPSMAVQVIGLNSVPVAGDEFEAVDSLDIARQRAEECAIKLKVERLSSQAGEAKVTLSALANSVTEGRENGLDRHQFNIVLKVDVQGSVAAIREALSVLPQDCVNLRFLMQAVGDISASDVDLALASEAIIIGFNVRVPIAVQTHAENRNVEIRLYKVIYELVDDMRKAMEGLLKPAEEQVPIGSAEVRAVFSSGSGRAAGCMVTEGKVLKGCGIRVVRNGTAIHIGTLDSLRRVKEVVKEVSAGMECGIGVKTFDDWHVGDTVEAFNCVAKRRTLEEASATVTAAVAASGVKQ
uniref:Translation initiation factor IF-2, chloroplastic n=1 Tax=Wollemia nobilis TaxID=56998 RepID=A0A0C9S379_9CONI